VRESAEEVIRRIVDFRRQIFGPEGLPPTPLDENLELEAGERLE
jgi:hypothetical protein